MSDSHHDETHTSNRTQPIDARKRTVFIIGLTVGIYMMIRGILGLAVPPVADHPVFEREMRVIAHRGGAGEFPENTLFAFQSAAALGVDAIEFDIHLTKDGVPVVIHDDDIFRTTNGRGRIESLSLSEIQSFDAAYWWPYGRKADCEICTNIPEKEFSYRGMGIRIPSLEEVLQALPDIPKIIEFKSSDPELIRLTGELLERYHQQSVVVVGSFHRDALRQFRNQFPEFATSAHQNEVLRMYILSLIGFGGAFPPGPEYFQVPVKKGPLTVANQRFLSAAREANTRVQVWTIDDAAQMSELLNEGFDGIITNEPSVLMDLVQD